MGFCGWGEIPNRQDYIVCSPSALISFREDPEIYKMRYVDKEDEKTSSMEFGSLVHLRVLQPEKFESEYAIFPEKTPDNDFDSERLKSMCKEFGEKVTGTKRELAERLRVHIPGFKIYEEIIDEMSSCGKKLLPHATMKKLNIIHDKIYSHHQVGEWMRLGESEKKGYWQDPETGIVMPFVADRFFKYKNIGIIIDLKITTYFEDRRFQNSNYDEGRAIQAASYLKAISEIEGHPFDNFLFVAIEPNAPHRIRYYQLDHAAIEAGEVEMKYYLKEFKERWTNKDWSPRSEDIKIKTTSLNEWNWTAINELETENV